MRMLNVSNHPKSGWSKEQKAGWTITDVPFPAIDPKASEEEILSLAVSFAEQVKESYRNYTFDAIMLMGEFSFCYLLLAHLLDWLIENNISIAIPTTARKVVERNGKRTNEFEFVRWRLLSPALFFRQNKEERK